MEIRYELTEDDVIAFNVYHVKNSEVGKKSLRWQRLISPLIFLLFAYFLSVFSELPPGPLFVGFGLTAVAWMVLYPKYFYWHVTRQVRKMLKEGKNDGLVGSHVLKMKKSGLTDSTSNGETSVAWSGIVGMREDTAHFYLYNSSVSAYILPKRDMDPEAFQRYMKQWLR